MTNDTLYERLGVPRFLLCRAELGDCNRVGARYLARLCLERDARVFYQQIMARTIRPAGLDESERLFDLPERVFNQRLEVNALRGTVG